MKIKIEMSDDQHAALDAVAKAHGMDNDAVVNMLIADRVKTITKRTGAKRANDEQRMFYEIYVEVDGRELYDRDLYEFAEDIDCAAFDEAMPMLLAVGSARPKVLRVRSRILKRYPTADVTIYEFPATMAEQVDTAGEDEFQPSRDRKTLVPRRVAVSPHER